MTRSRGLMTQAAFTLLPILVSVLVSALLVMLVGRNPIEVFQKVWEGAFRNSRSVASVFNFWIPLTLVSMGLIVTFRAGLWNIGIEGQMMAGAIFAGIVPMAIMQSGVDPETLSPSLVLTASILLAVLGGMLLAALAALLKVFLGVNEIFGGVALNALVDVFSIYLISGPWQPEIGGSAQATEPFPEVALYPSISPQFPTSLLAIITVLISTAAIILALRGTRWGLQLKAVGLNPKSAVLLGVPVSRSLFTSFLVCGALAGLAGSYRSLFTYTSLRPLASGGIGFLGLLVVLLVSMRGLWVPFVTFVFAAILAGSTRLRVSLQLDSSLAGVLQSTLVLFMLLFSGLRERVTGSSPEAAEPESVESSTPPLASDEVVTS